MIAYLNKLRLAASVQYTLGFDSFYGGSASGDGVYSSGTVVNITATDGAGHTFVRWIGDVSEIADIYDPTTTITMDADYNIAPLFYHDECLAYKADIEGKPGATPLSESLADYLNGFFHAAITTNNYYSKLKQLIIGLTCGGVAASGGEDAIASTSVTWVNSPTQDSLIGVVFNGTNQYANSNKQANTTFTSANDWQEFAFPIVGITPGTTMIIVGAASSASSQARLYANVSGVTRTRGTSNISADATALVAEELLLGSRSSNVRLDTYQDGVSTGNSTTTSTGALPSLNIFYGADNNAGTPGSYCDGRWCFFGLASGLTSTDVANFSADVKTFLTNIGAI